MPPPRHTPVHIPHAPSAAPLTPQQKQFNRHVERIEEQRTLLAAWQEAVDGYHARHAREYLPLYQAHCALRIEWVRHLDAASDDKTLSRADRQTLGEAITGHLAPLIDDSADAATRAELQSIYHRHGGSGRDTEEAAGSASAQEKAQELFGREPDGQGMDPDSPEDFMRRLDEQLHTRQAQAEQQRATARQSARARKLGARQRKEQEAAAQATQSLREIYRRLASALHPDRETDPAERERKTALMQRVNQAYADHKLLDLLQLQLEIAQIDAAHIAGLGEERLRHYNRVLAAQLDELQSALRALEAPFLPAFGAEPRTRLKPADLQRALRAHMQALEQDTMVLRQQLQRLRADPAALKPWIRSERLRQKKAHGEDLAGWF